MVTDQMGDIAALEILLAMAERYDALVRSGDAPASTYSLKQQSEALAMIDAVVEAYSSMAPIERATEVLETEKVFPIGPLLPLNELRSGQLSEPPAIIKDYLANMSTSDLWQVCQGLHSNPDLTAALVDLRQMFVGVLFARLVCQMKKEQEDA